MKIWNLGYPRIGTRQELIEWIREFEAGTLSTEALQNNLKILMAERWARQHALGVDSIPVNDLFVFDPLLELSLMLGVVPKRHSSLSGDFWQRCRQVAKDSRETRWFNSTYHVIAPEFDADTTLKSDLSPLKFQLEHARSYPYRFHATLVGPWTFLRFAMINNLNTSDAIDRLLEGYRAILAELKRRNIEWVVMEEPRLCQGIAREDLKSVRKAYEGLAGLGIKICLAPYYGSASPYLADLAALPVDGLFLDLCEGKDALQWLRTRSFPKEKLMVLGVVAGKNIWKSDLKSTNELLTRTRELYPNHKIAIAPSCPLVHLPLTIERETSLDRNVLERMSFSDERCSELRVLKNAARRDPVALEYIAQESSKKGALLKSGSQLLPEVRDRVEHITPEMKDRKTHLVKKGARIENEELLKEQCGIDFLVSGQGDDALSVQKFVQGVVGFEIMEAGWVQTAYHTAVRPPLLLSDVKWMKEESEKTNTGGLKARVPGPMTILHQSFVREDLDLRTIGFQVALALRDEIHALEKLGAKAILVEEKGLWESLPLKKSEWQPYLRWAMDCFRIATSVVSPKTQIHMRCDQSDVLEIWKFIERTYQDVRLSSYPNQKCAGRF